MHVTVLMPSYNTSKYIASAMLSVYQQTHKDWDLLIVDDGSTDGTADVAEEVCKGHDCSILRLKSNRGVANATRVGIKHARGDVITVVDSDDLIFAHSLQIGLTPFTDPNVGFVWTKFIRSDNRMGWSHALPKNWQMWDALTKFGWWKAAHQRFFRKSVYLKSPGIDPSFRTASDLQLTLLVSSTGCKCVHVPCVTYWYRFLREGSITKNLRTTQSSDAKGLVQWARQGFQKTRSKNTSSVRNTGVLATT